MKYGERLAALVWYGAVAVLVWAGVRYALVWLLPFLLALGLAMLLEPLMEQARRRLRLKRGFTAAVVTLVLVGGLLAGLIVMLVQAVEQALAQARKNAGGDGGGGGGEGDGPGGGGLNEVHLGQIMLAVRPNWSFASASRANLACVVHVVVDGNGGIVDAQVTRGSGNAQFDASAVNAVIRTGKAGLFPKPPSPEYGDMDLFFRLDEFSCR